MASQILKVLTSGGIHATGAMSSWKARTLPNGATVITADIDNFTAVELAFDEDGNRTCVQLATATTPAYLIDGVERRTDYEGLSCYYNEVGETVRIWILDKGIRFQTSAFSKNTGVTTITNGYVAHFDPATKKYIISNPASAHADYATAGTKYTVVNTDNETEYLDGKEVIRLEVQ